MTTEAQRTQRTWSKAAIEFAAAPCPFCGGLDLATPPGIPIVVCGTCGASGPVGLPHPTDRGLVVSAFLAWNKRY